MSNTSRAAAYQKDYFKLVPVFPPIFYPFSAISKLINLRTAWHANQKTALMLHRLFFVYFSVIPLIVSVSYFEILRFLSVTEIYIKMSEILIIWLSALVAQMAPYLIFIPLHKSTHSVNVVLYSQNARLC